VFLIKYRLENRTQKMRQNLKKCSIYQRWSKTTTFLQNKIFVTQRDHIQRLSPNRSGPFLRSGAQPGWPEEFVKKSPKNYAINTYVLHNLDR
jgi:hypothetical protein